MPARHQDVWYRPMSDIPLTEPRWAKMVEIRPTNLKGRRIVHHSIAYLVLNNDPEAVNTGTANGFCARPRIHRPIDLVNRRPQLMEWAIGKGYDLFREGTGKLLLPGEKISWDQHLHAVGEEITAGSEIGIWLYPKGQEPKKRSYLIGFTGLRKREFLDIPPNSIAQTEGFTVLKENTLITNFQPHFHLRGKAMQVEAILPDGTQPDRQLRRQLQLQLDDELHLRRRCGAGVSEGHDHPRERVVRQHQGQQVQPRSGSVGGLRRPHGGRDGARLDERGLSHRRRIQGAARGAQGEGRDCGVGRTRCADAAMSRAVIGTSRAMVPRACVVGAPVSLAVGAAAARASPSGSSARASPARSKAGSTTPTAAATFSSAT